MIFSKKSKSAQRVSFGCVSRRDKDFVVFAGEAGGRLVLSKLSRRASTETLRLDSAIITATPNFQVRNYRFDDLRFENETDYLKIGAGYLSLLQSQGVNLKEKRATFTVDQSGVVNGITAPEKDITEAALSVEAFRARSDENCPVLVETRARAAMRVFLHQNLPLDDAFGTEAFGDADEKEISLDASATVCVVVIEGNGHSIAFWNQAKGICWEVEQPFVDSEEEVNWAAVADELRRLLTLESLQSLNLAEVNHIAVAAPAECFNFLQQELTEDNIELEQILFVEGVDYLLAEESQSLADTPTEAIIAAGLYLTDERVTAINLNQDLAEDIRLQEQERVRKVQVQTATATRNLTLLLLAPALLTILCGLVYGSSLYFQDGYLSERETKAKAEETRLSGITREIEQVKTSSEQFQKVAESIGALKKRQPANFLLLMTLNRKWPSGEGVWQIDEITSKADGIVTIKGKTTSDESLTEFAKNLDFSEDFDAVKVSKGENSPNGIAPVAYNNAAGGGVIKFAIEARYLPLAQTTKTAPGPTAPVIAPVLPPGQVTTPAQGTGTGSGTTAPSVAGVAAEKKPNS